MDLCIVDHLLEEEFEDNKVIIRSCKSEDIQHNDKKDKKTNNDL